MTEAPSHLIRIAGGGVRVLRLAVNAERCYPLRYDVPLGHAYCHACGCTDERACIGRCAWADRLHTICTRCAAMYPLLTGEDGDL